MLVIVASTLQCISAYRYLSVLPHVGIGTEQFRHIVSRVRVLGSRGQERH